MKKVSLLLLSFIYTTIIHAQYNLSGQVIDETKQGMAYTTIQLLHNDSTFIQGTTTDSIGCFIMKGIKKENIYSSPTL